MRHPCHAFPPTHHQHQGKIGTSAWSQIEEQRTKLAVTARRGEWLEEVEIARCAVVVGSRGAQGEVTSAGGRVDSMMGSARERGGDALREGDRGRVGGGGGFGGGIAFPVDA